MAGFFRRYVPVDQRRMSAKHTIAEMRGKGVEVQPVRIEGRLIASTFWGKAWCEHLESFSDFANRLPRGRTYVRNGSVCHLEITSGTIHALVQGSDLYTVTIQVAALPRPAWQAIKRQCTGKISSLLDLLQGRLSAGVMEIVTDRRTGLFPQPRQIAMDCSCPDWAVMCKHVAAVLYGVGSRLDERPELLFLLRGVDHEELVDEHAEAAVKEAVREGTGRRIAESDLAEVFGIELEKSVKPAARAPRKRKTAPPFPRVITGSDIRRLRERLTLSRRDFARLLDVSQATLSIWERTDSVLRLQGRTRASLQRVWKSG